MSAFSVGRIKSDIAHQHCDARDYRVADKLPGGIGIPLVSHLGGKISQRQFYFEVLIKERQVMREVGIDNETRRSAHEDKRNWPPFKTSFGPGDNDRPNKCRGN